MKNYDNPVNASLKFEKQMLHSCRKLKSKTNLERNETEESNLHKGEMKMGLTC